MSLIASVAQSEDWYRWRGPNLDGISTETNWNSDLSAGARITWRADVGVGFSSFVVRDNRVLTTGFADDQDTLFCFDAAQGKQLWKYSYPATLDDRDFEGGPTSTPTIDGDRVYMINRPGELYCFQAETGELLWSKQVAEATEVRVPGWGFAAAPLVIDDKLILNVGEAAAAFNKLDGNILWSSDNKEAGYGTPVPHKVGDKTEIVIASSRSYIGVDLESGEKRWMERWLTSFGCNAADPILHDGKMFLSSGYNRGAALYRFVDDKPELVWKSKEMQNQLHTSILHDQFLFGIDGNVEAGARLRCLAWDTGEVQWSQDELRPGGILIADGKLLVLTDSGELVICAASPTEFRELSRAKVLDGKCWTVPVLSNGLLYCRSVDGQVACIDLRKQ